MDSTYDKLLTVIYINLRLPQWSSFSNRFTIVIKVAQWYRHPPTRREIVWSSGYPNRCKQPCYKRTRIKVNIYWKKCVSYVRAESEISCVPNHLTNSMRICIKNHCGNDVIDGEIVSPLIQPT